MVKKLKLILTLSLAFGTFSFFNTVNSSVVSAAIDASDADSYYDSLYDDYGNLLYKGKELLNELNKLISTDISTTTYSGLSSVYKTTDVDPSNSNNVILYYTGESRAFNFSNFSGTINREHVWPQSHFGASTSTTTSPYADAHHVRPCDSSLNSSRQNSYYDELTSGNTDSYGNMWSGGIFYPSEAYRGDAARICFYVATRYTNLSFVDNATTGDTGQNMQMGNLSALLKWNEEYSVSSSEIRRNNAVAEIQNNRNPFIDHPEFAEYIWGDGVYDGGDTATTYSVIFKTLGGSEVETQKVEENGLVSKPSDPTKTGYTFGGWYLDQNCTTPYDFSSKVTGSLILYAKWVSNTTNVDVLEISLTAKAQGYTNAYEVTTLNADPVTLTFAKGSGSTTPKYYSSGDAVRLYAKNTLNVSATKPIKSITLSFGSSDGSNTITSSNGTFSSPTWTPSNEETTSVTFTVGGTNGNRRINKITVEFFKSEEIDVNLANTNIETALSFSYQETASTSSEVTFEGNHSSLTSSSPVTDKNGCSYSNSSLKDSDLASFGVKEVEKGYLACETNNKENHILKLGTGSVSGSVTLLNVDNNASSVRFKASGWSNGVVLTLENATYNNSSTLEISTTYNEYNIDIIDPTLDVRIYTSSTTSSDLRFFFGDVAFTTGGSTYYTFDNFLMRYKVDIDKETFDTINGISFGALVNTVDNNPNYIDTTVSEFDSLYNQTNNYLNIEIDETKIEDNGDSYTLSAALTNIPNTDLETEVVIAFYIKTESKVYFSNTKTYSISTLVDAYLNEYSSYLTAEEIEILTMLDSSI